MKRQLHALFVVALLIVVTPARALNSWGTDMSDLWWVPSESGWGANIAHQREIIFITIFVYGPDGSTRWYVGPALTSAGGAATYVFAGDLYETRGPFLGGPFNPSSVTTRRVGTASVAFSSTSRGALTYTVDGTSVTKNIERQTFREADPNGAFSGSRIGSVTGCASSGPYGEDLSIGASKNGSTVTMTSLTAGGQFCTYTGAFSQAGRMSRVDGTFSCSPSRSGTFVLYELEIGAVGFTALYEANFSGCTDRGRIGAARIN